MPMSDKNFPHTAERILDFALGGLAEWTAGAAVDDTDDHTVLFLPGFDVNPSVVGETPCIAEQVEQNLA